MKTLALIGLLIFSAIGKTTEIKAEDWLLWHKLDTKLPFTSALTIFPPVMLYADSGELKGIIATPYALQGEENNLINQFLIVVTDANNKSHFLIPDRQSVGFADEQGIVLAALKSKSFHDGKISIRFYKANSPKNRQKLSARLKRNAEATEGVKLAIDKLKVPKPAVGTVWDLNANTAEGQPFSNIVADSEATIVQLYTPTCGFCQKAIPIMNKIAKRPKISVVGLSATANTNEFKQHLMNTEIKYEFITFEGEYAEQALLKSLGQLGFPTYFVVDNTQTVTNIFVGTESLLQWLENTNNHIKDSYSGI